MERAVLITTLALLPVGLSAQDASSQYDELVAGFAKETAQHRKADAKIAPLLPAVSPFHDRFLAAARQHEGKQSALPYLGWLLQNSPRNRDAHGIAVKAIDALAKQRALRLLDGADLAGVVGKLYQGSRKAVRFLKYNRATDEVFAKTLLDAKVLAMVATDVKIRKASARSVFKLERLQVGMVAPDIRGKDLDGNPFKLSDYRGKVVVIDFWGDW